VTLATALVNRQTTASKLIDDGFNRLSTFHKDGLPTWFLDDESKYYKPNIPLTKEAIDALREKQRALDARPIKKIAEAKARKKFKAVQRVEKAKKKADKKIVVAKGANRGVKGRPKGVKGKYKIVDARMRKEVGRMRVRLRSKLMMWLGPSAEADQEGKQEAMISRNPACIYRIDTFPNVPAFYNAPPA